MGSYIVCSAHSDFFLPIDTGTGTHSIGKNGIKIKQIGNFYQSYVKLRISSKKEKVKTKQDIFISLL